MLRRVLITLDAVGGVWRYAIDVARGLRSTTSTACSSGSARNRTPPSAPSAAAAN